MKKLTRDEKKALKKAIGDAMADPAVFCERLLHIKPFIYQESFLRDSSKRIVMCAGRRIGKSIMTGAKALHFVLTHDKVTVLIVSATLRQSMIMFDTILDYISENELIQNSVVRQTRTLVRFDNRSWIKALPCGKGKGLRGDTAHLLIMDEAAYMPEEVISEVLLPMLATTDGTAIMLSTPWSKEHIFYKAFTSERWSKYHYPTSINPIVKPEFLVEQRELVGEQRFLQEYEAQFTDDDQSYFPSALLRNSLHVCESTRCDYCDFFLPEPEGFANFCNAKRPSSSLYGGYDPGGKGDPAAFVILEKMKNNVLRVDLARTYLSMAHGKKVEDSNLYTRFTAEISEIHKKIHMQKLWVDETGLGQPIVEQCRGLGLPAEGMSLTSKSKEELFSNLKILFENRKIILPSADLDLKLKILANFTCINAEAKPAGGWIFHHAPGSHDDIAYALALAAWGATRGGGIVSIMKADEPSTKSTWRFGAEYS